MPDFPNLPPLPFSVSTFSRFSGMGIGSSILGLSISVASITWPSANLAFYIPVSLPWPYPVRRVWWINGSSVTTVNMDFGIYTHAGTLIYSTGSTAEVGASAVQYVTPTEFLLSPGRYYFALACSSGTANRGGQGSTATAIAPNLALVGMLQEASALPLPATMTPVTIANVCMPICGITRTAS